MAGRDAVTNREYKGVKRSALLLCLSEHELSALRVRPIANFGWYINMHACDTIQLQVGLCEYEFRTLMSATTRDLRWAAAFQQYIVSTTKQRKWPAFLLLNSRTLHYSALMIPSLLCLPKVKST